MIERAMPKSTSFTVPMSPGGARRVRLRVARQHDVRRLEIAMENPAPVRRGEPRRRTGHHVRRLVGRESALRA